MNPHVPHRLEQPDTELGTLTSGVVEAIGSAIVAGEYAPYEILPVEAALCARYHASRSVLREAVKILSAKGLVTARRRRGTSITKPSAWDLLDADVLRWILRGNFSLPLLIEFTDMRLCIEPIAAARAATFGDRDAIDAIRAAYRRMEAATHGKDDPLEADIVFHLAILNGCGNRFISRMQPLIEAALLFSIRYTDHQTQTADIKLKRHERVVAAIEAGDADAAEIAARELLLAARAVMERG